MKRRDLYRMPITLSLILSGLILAGCELPDPPSSGGTIPSEYAGRHMPEGWWTDQEIIESGRKIYLGNQASNVNCAKCHGETGRPVKGGARNFQNIDAMKTYSDSHLFWRISEGVPFSTMVGYKGALSADEIWKVIAFVTTLGLNGLQYDPKVKAWVPSG